MANGGVEIFPDAIRRTHIALKSGFSRARKAQFDHRMAMRCAILSAGSSSSDPQEKIFRTRPGAPSSKPDFRGQTFKIRSSRSERSGAIRFLKTSVHPAGSERQAPSHRTFCGSAAGSENSRESGEAEPTTGVARRPISRVTGRSPVNGHHFPRRFSKMRWKTVPEHRACRRGPAPSAR